MTDFVSRREFLKLSSGLAAGFAFKPWQYSYAYADFPDTEFLARVAVGKVDLLATPDIYATRVGPVYEDAVLPWLRQVVGSNPVRHNQMFVETPQGYIWSADIQPVRNQPQEAIKELPVQNELGPGMWVQVTVPWADVFLENKVPYASFVKNRVEQGLLPRLYYSQVFWVNDLEIDEEGQVWYRIDQAWDRGDVFWGRAEYFRIMSEEEVLPISPDVDPQEKLIEVNLARQTLSAYEAGREVFFCRISSGKDGEDTHTPVTPVTSDGTQIWRKMFSAYMEGNITGAGYSIPGIGFTSLFTSNGIAIHSTFWHNNYGEKTSHGCVNVRPEDAKWIFRWTTPYVAYDPGEWRGWEDPQYSTIVKVIEY